MSTKHVCLPSVLVAVAAGPFTMFLSSPNRAGIVILFAAQGHPLPHEPAHYGPACDAIAAGAESAFRILTRDAKKYLKRTRPYFDVPPFLMCDRLFRIQEIAGFGGGVKCKFQNSKRGVVGGA